VNVAVTYNNAINTDGKLARAFGAHEFAAGYGGRWAARALRCDHRNE
jgi:hypothetical protein